ncbi:MAG: M6 family metalloprotease domain-containing protein [Candidatus Latescibacteria bacterium]|nr:M6 family metalloprotease domain-containing protein [Candidatus Latescibacterota bacterium]
MPRLILLAILWLATPVLAEGFRCAGSQGTPIKELLPPEATAKPAVPTTTTGPRLALLVFARFQDEPARPVPSWAADLFNPDLPGSISHFYDTMSFGQLPLRGEVAPRVYASAQPASAYVTDDPTQNGRVGQFTREILLQVDQEVDFSRFDADGDQAVDVVFVVLDQVPANFIQGPATGYGRLGFLDQLKTADRSAAGPSMYLLPQQGTVQQGRTFAEAAGSICHEYGHVLGLPDLYNTAFLSTPHLGPEDDDAGVGRWCLMGWGATGWQGDDGPNSFCAWSRTKMGWAVPLEVVETSADVELEEVSRRGQCGLVGLPGGLEYFLLEYRRRTGYYDRHLPGEGLLIWHVDKHSGAPRVDLECADGRWQEAGYPEGMTPDPRSGGDNLDFWAHDAAYARTHAGNLGDATDPFDGVQYRSFTTQTNPGSQGEGITGDLRIEGISLDGDRARLRISQSADAVYAIEQVWLEDEDGDGLLGAEEAAQLHFQLSSPGPLRWVVLRVRVQAADTLAVVAHGEAVFRGTYDELANRSNYTLEPGEGLVLRGAAGISQGTHLALQLEIYDEIYGRLLWRQPLRTETLSQRLQGAALAFIDTLGNRDWAAQPGELIEARLVVEHPVSLRGVALELRPLDGQAQMVNGPQVDQAQGLAPRFLVSASAAGTLSFELEAHNGGEIWRDTLFAELAAGRDQTPPQVLFLQVRVHNDSLLIRLPPELVLEGGGMRAAEARIHRDGVQVGQVPLQAVPDGGYEGTWAGARPGRYLVEGMATDLAGNQGLSPRQVVEVDDPGRGVVPLLATASGAVVMDLAATADGSLLAAADSNQVHLYRGLSLEEAGNLPVRYVRALAFSPQGRWLATGGPDGLVRLWELATRREAGFRGRHLDQVEALAFSPDGRWLAAAGADGVVQVWELQTFRRVAALNRPVKYSVLCLAFAPGGEVLAAGDREGQISLWDVARGELAGALTGHTGAVEAVAFSPDGHWLAAAGFDQTVRLWDLAASSAGAVLHQGRVPMRSVAFSADSQLLAAGSGDGMVYLWQVAARRQLDRLETGSSVKGLAFSPFGERLATGSINGQTWLWQVRREGSGTGEVRPADTVLLPAYPNPFTAGVVLPYRLAQQEKVTLAVYNLAGQLVRVLASGPQNPGAHEVRWDGRDNTGEALARGVYLCRLQAGVQVETRKLLLLR